MKVTAVNLTEVAESFGIAKDSPWFVKELNYTAKQYKDALVPTIKETYTLRQSKGEMESLISLRKAVKGANPTATISIRHNAVKLSQFRVKQVAITTGGFKQVTSNSSFAGYSQRSVQASVASTYTKVEIVRGGGFKLIKGRFGYKGFLQDTYDQIFERKQKNTWVGASRAPIHALYSLTVAQMANSQRIRAKMKVKDYKQRLTSRLVGRVKNFFGGSL